MKGLSITAIGMRSLEKCLEIFQILHKPMHLEFLELAIGSPCPVDFDYPSVSLILHDPCLYKQNTRLRLDLLRPKTWQPYAEFIANHDVQAMSIHPPHQHECTKQELETALLNLQETLNVPVYVEVMPFQEYWCSSLKTLVNHPLLLDVSHISIWFKGDHHLAQQTCLYLLNSYHIGEIHLSHNEGKADTHDLIPANIWFANLIEKWNLELLMVK